MTKMVQLSDQAYLRLRNMKRGNESFSDVVLRLTGNLRPKVPTLSGLKSMRTDAEREEHLRWISEVDALDKPTRARR